MDGSTCFDGEVNPAAGRLHEVAVGDSYTVTRNTTVLHEPGTVVRGTVTPRSADEYERTATSTIIA